MRGFCFYAIALGLVFISAAVLSASLFVDVSEPMVMQPLLYALIAALVSALLWGMFDPVLRRGMDATYDEMYGGVPSHERRSMHLFDEDWGWFGRQHRSKPLKVMRAFVVFGFVPFIVFGGPDLWTLRHRVFICTGMITIALTMIYHALATRRG